MTAPRSRPEALVAMVLLLDVALLVGAQKCDDGSSVLSSSANNGVGCCDDKSYYYCPKAVRHNSL